jgi:hypothetical protein
MTTAKGDGKMFFRSFKSYESAHLACRQKNQSYKLAGNRKDMVAIVQSPQGDWCVVDLATAIELGQGYAIV